MSWLRRRDIHAHDLIGSLLAAVLAAGLALFVFILLVR